jgi:hypothetical protein
MDKRLVFGGVCLATGLLAWGLGRANRVYGIYSPSEFFQPHAVASIAKQFPYTSEDEFTLAAWDYVGRQIPYEPLGSDMEFGDLAIECEDCYFPMQVIARNKGNCVAKSSLLASILTNRIANDRVSIMVGDLYSARNSHAWVSMERGGSWYILESTAPPDKRNPWLPEEQAYAMYNPHVEINTDYIISGDDVVADAACNCRQNKIGRLK